MADDDKPFACPTPGCGMRFVNEDHLSVHKMKHEMSLPLAGTRLSGSLLVGQLFPSNIDFSTDQTPTPTKFLRNCEEIGLFSELSKNPFEDAFKKAVQENIPHAAIEVNSENGPLGGASVEVGTLNTPTPHGLLLHSSSVIRNVETYNPLPGPSSDSGSTLDTPAIQFYKSASTENEAAIDLRMNNAASSPVRVRNDETMSDVDVEHSPKSDMEEELTITSQSVIGTQSKATESATRTEVHEVITLGTGEQVLVTTDEPRVPRSIASQLNATSPTTPTTSTVHASLAQTPSGPVQSIMSSAATLRPQYLMQVLVQLPGGQTMPLQFPATMAPGGGITVGSVQQPAPQIQTPPQPPPDPQPVQQLQHLQPPPQRQQLSQQIHTAMSTVATSVTCSTTPAVTTAPTTISAPTSEVTTTTNLPSSASAITKQKLKAAITQNVQQSVLQSNMRVMTEAVERVTASPSQRPQTILKSPQLTISPSPTSSVSSVFICSPSSSLSPEVQMQAADTSTPYGSKRARKSPEEDPDERRRKFLERNRAAAARCRQKRKQWINNLERKADDINGTNLKLQTEINQLRAEVAQLKSLLLAHKNCPIFVQQRNSGQINLETVNVQTVELRAEGSEASTSTTKVTTLNLSSSSELAGGSTSKQVKVTSRVVSPAVINIVDDARNKLYVKQS